MGSGQWTETSTGQIEINFEQDRILLGSDGSNLQVLSTTAADFPQTVQVRTKQ